MIEEMQTVTDAFVEITNGLDDQLFIVNQPFKDVTAACTVVFQADGGRQAIEGLLVDEDSVVGIVREMAEVEIITRIGVGGGIESALAGGLFVEFVVIEVIAIDRVGGEEIVSRIGTYGEGTIDDGDGDRNDLRFEI